MATKKTTKTKKTAKKAPAKAAPAKAKPAKNKASAKAAPAKKPAKKKAAGKAVKAAAPKAAKPKKAAKSARTTRKRVAQIAAPEPESIVPAPEKGVDGEDLEQSEAALDLAQAAKRASLNRLLRV